MPSETGAELSVSGQAELVARLTEMRRGQSPDKADQGADCQTHREYADFDQHIARRQDVEERLDAQPDLVHALRSGMS